MKCPNCGAQARDGSRFCMACGVELSSPRIIDPSEAETVVAPTLSPTPEKKRAASLGPAGTLPGMSTEGQGIDLASSSEPSIEPAAADLPRPPEPVAPPPPPEPQKPAGVDPRAITVEPPAQGGDPTPQVVVDIDELEPPAEPSPTTAEPQAAATPDPQPAAPEPAATPDPQPAATDPAAGEVTGLTDQWMALGEEQAEAPHDLTAGVEAAPGGEQSETVDDVDPSAEGDFDDDDEDEPKKGGKGKIIGGIACGCLLLFCCGGLVAWVFGLGGLSMIRGLLADADPSSDPGAAETLLGDVTIDVDTATIYASNSTDSSVIDTAQQGETVEWLGWDETLTFFRVRTADGEEGYLLSTEARYAG